MAEAEDYSGTLLNQPLSIGELIENGTQFEINTNFDDNLPDELFDEVDIGESDEEDEDKRQVIISPWEKTFADLRTQMLRINEFLYKRVTQVGSPEFGMVPDHARVIFRYNAYWEGDVAPFDSSFMRGDSVTYHCGRGDVLPGIEQAVKTMQKGEEAQFVISYHLLFREMGCPPRVKPKADGLYIIKLVNFTDVGDANALEDVPEEDRNKFAVVHDRVKEVHKKGLDFFRLGNIQAACRSFHKAVNALQFCRLSDQKEQEVQQQFLIKLLLNLTVCYNRLNLPLKTCSMCNEIRKLTNMNQNCKALFQEGRALIMIGDYLRAREQLQRAQRLEPYNAEIIQELKLLEKKNASYKQNEREIWRKAMGLVEDTEARNETEADHLVAFKTEIGKYLKEFRANRNNKDLTLPDGLSAEEVHCIDELATQLDLKLSVTNVGGQRNYVIARSKTIGESTV